MKVIRTIFLFFLLVFIGCEKNSYNEILRKAKTLDWHNDMVEAKEALELTRMAMAKKPKKWDAYSLELSIYSSWNHKSKDYSNNFNGIKSVCRRVDDTVWIIYEESARLYCAFELVERLLVEYDSCVVFCNDRGADLLITHDHANVCCTAAHLRTI